VKTFTNSTAPSGPRLRHHLIARASERML
jgi:hypothetical protein